MDCLHGISFTKNNIGLVTKTQYSAQQENATGNTQSFCVHSAENRVRFNQAVYQVKKNISPASELKKSAVGNNSCIVFFWHPVYFVHMQFHHTQSCRIYRWETKLVWYLPDHDLLHNNGIIPDRFNNPLYPLPAAELKIDHAAWYPGLDGSVFLF